MNCPNCDAPPDYRFSTRCSYCESDLSTPNEISDSLTTVLSTKDRLTLGNHFANLVLVVSVAAVGAFMGAVVIYCVGGIVYLTLVASYGPRSCAEGAFVGILLVLAGGFFGCIAGTIAGYQNRIKRQVSL